MAPIQARRGGSASSAAVSEKGRGGKRRRRCARVRGEAWAGDADPRQKPNAHRRKKRSEGMREHSGSCVAGGGNRRWMTRQ
ncbi:hypothetical protein [Azospirillum argentinense]